MRHNNLLTSTCFFNLYESIRSFPIYLFICQSSAIYLFGIWFIIIIFKFYLIYFIQISVVWYSLQQNQTFFFGIPSWVMTSNEEHQSLTVSPVDFDRAPNPCQPWCWAWEHAVQVPFLVEFTVKWGRWSQISYSAVWWHHENMMSKQEPEHRKGVWGQRGLPGGSHGLILKEHHPLGKKARTRR